MASIIRPTSNSPSNTRSTPIEASAVLNRTGNRCCATYARANSPARGGSRLFARTPMAVACHSGPGGNRAPPTSRRIRRQRTARSGNVSVASATATSSSSGSARRTYPTNSRASTPCSAHASSPSVTASPTIHAQREADAPLLGGAGLGSEGNEVADFVDEGPERIARRGACRGAQLLRALERPVAAVQQRADIDHRQRLRRRRARPGRPAGRPLEPCRAHAALPPPVVRPPPTHPG